MHTLSSASRTCIASSSAVECTATVGMPSSLQARSTRSAISPRLAMRILSNIAPAFSRAGTTASFETRPAGAPQDEVFETRPAGAPQDEVFETRPAGAPQDEVFETRPAGAPQDEVFETRPAG